MQYCWLFHYDLWTEEVARECPLISRLAIHDLLFDHLIVAAGTQQNTWPVVQELRPVILELVPPDFPPDCLWQPHLFPPCCFAAPQIVHLKCQSLWCLLQGCVLEEPLHPASRSAACCCTLCILGAFWGVALHDTVHLGTLHGVYFWNVIAFLQG